MLRATSGLDRPAIGCGQEINARVFTATRFTSKIQYKIQNPKSKYILVGYKSKSKYIYSWVTDSLFRYGYGSSISKRFGSESRS